MGWEADIEAWRKVIEVNLFGLLLLRPRGPQTHGGAEKRRRVEHHSVHEKIAWSGGTALYTASKAAVAC